MNDIKRSVCCAKYFVGLCTEQERKAAHLLQNMWFYTNNIEFCALFLKKLVYLYTDNVKVFNK